MWAHRRALSLDLGLLALVGPTLQPLDDGVQILLELFECGLRARRL